MDRSWPDLNHTVYAVLLVGQLFDDLTFHGIDLCSAEKKKSTSMVNWQCLIGGRAKEWQFLTASLQATLWPRIWSDHWLEVSDTAFDLHQHFLGNDLAWFYDWGVLVYVRCGAVSASSVEGLMMMMMMMMMMIFANSLVVILIFVTDMSEANNHKAKKTVGYLICNSWRIALFLFLFLSWATVKGALEVSNRGGPNSLEVS